jgi:arylsulfatase A-like enzyme
MMAPQRYLERFPETMDRDRRMHAAMVAALDDAIGEVMGALRRRGLAENTVVFFMSDNGATEEERADHRGRRYQGGSNGPFRGSKGSLFEGGTRVPAMLAWPGRIGGRQVRGECGMAMDILPTFLEWAGGGPSGGPMDGASLAGALAGRAAWPERDLFWAYDGQTAVRRGNWKLVEKPRERLNGEAAAEPWLSDLGRDPGEKTNRAKDAGSPLAELQTALAEWLAAK